MNYSTLLMTLYPGITKKDFVLQDDGDGVYIKEWKYSQPAPTKSLAQLHSENITAVEEKQRELEASANKVLNIHEISRELQKLRGRVDAIISEM